MNGKYRDDQRGRAWQRDANNYARPDTKSNEPPRQTRRLLMEFGKTQLLLAGYQGDGVRCPFGLCGAERGKRSSLWQCDGLASSETENLYPCCLRHDRQRGEWASGILHAPQQQALHARGQSRRHVRS